MATLAEAVDATETDWLVSADIPDTVDYLTVESEVVQVTATFPAQYQARDGSTSEPRIRVVRAAGGTTAASHADATALTPLIPPSAAGGGAAEAGTVVVQLTGTETDYAHIFRGDEDPADTPAFLAILVAGDLWIDTSASGPFAPVYARKVRNETNDGWLPDGLILFDALGNHRATIRVEDQGGDVFGAFFQALNAAGDTIAQLHVSSAGDVQLTGAGGRGVTIAANETVVVDGFGGAIYLAADSTIKVNAAGGAELEISGTNLFKFTLPTADPAQGGQWWNDAGTVKVSAG